MAFAAGVNLRWAASMSAFAMTWSTTTAVPSSVSEPAPGSVTIFTLAKLSMVSASTKPKSAAVKVRPVSSFVVTVLFEAVGAVFAGRLRYSVRAVSPDQLRLSIHE